MSAYKIHQLINEVGCNRGLYEWMCGARLSRIGGTTRPLFPQWVVPGAVECKVEGRAGARLNRIAGPTPGTKGWSDRVWFRRPPLAAPQAYPWIHSSREGTRLPPRGRALPPPRTNTSVVKSHPPERVIGVTRSSQDLEGAACCDPQNPLVGDLSRSGAGGARCDMGGQPYAASTDQLGLSSPGLPVVHFVDESTP